MADSPGGGAGLAGWGGGLIAFAVGVFAIALVVNGIFNRLENPPKPFFSGIFGEWRSTAYPPPLTLPGTTRGRDAVTECAAKGGTRTINPNTGRPSCFVPHGSVPPPRFRGLAT